jgi:beta-phosphoglucomutase-like phosphatase (HAD superfamily)
MTEHKHKGVIFDFNGTLFFDSDKHEQAWKKFSADVRGYPFTENEMLHKVHGRTNRSILEYLLDKEIPDEVLRHFVAKKEAYYKYACLQDKENMKLVNGAIELFEFLNSRRIPMNIATAAEVTNLQFFNEQFGLSRWFDMDKIVFDDYNIKGKPFPDMFLAAVQNIGLSPADCLIFEDSMSGLEAAKAAGIRTIFMIDPKSDNSRFNNHPKVKSVLPDFTAFDPEIYF